MSTFMPSAAQTRALTLLNMKDAAVKWDGVTAGTVHGQLDRYRKLDVAIAPPTLQALLDRGWIERRNSRGNGPWQWHITNAGRTALERLARGSVGGMPIVE